MQFGILGPLRLRLAGGDQRVPPGRQRLLLALLVISARTTVSADRLIDVLWRDEPPDNPTNALQGRVSQLRKLLRAGGAEDLLVSRGPGYCLEVPDDRIDARCFEQLAARGQQELRAERPDAAAGTLREALGLWRGPALEDVLDEEWAAVEAHRLDELRLSALEARVNADFTLGRHDALVLELEQLMAQNPLRERLRGQLMLALYRVGRQADALGSYEAARRQLADELGIDPGPRLRELHQRILEQDPELDWKAVAAEPAVSGELPAAPMTRSAEADSPIGRARELQALTTAWHHVHGGVGAIVLVAGEPGIGKSHLVEGFARSLEGGDVRWGRCFEAEGAPAFWPWVQILRDLVEDLPADVLAAALGPGVGDVAQLVPEIKERLADTTAPIQLEAAQARFRLYDTVTRFLRRLAKGRPLALVLEDLHWADEASLDLLRLLATQIREAPLLVVITYRDGVDSEPGLRRALAALAGEPSAQWLPLEGFVRADVAHLTRLQLGAEPSEELVTALHDRTDGNPFFLSEVLALLTDHPADDERLSAEAFQEVVPVGVRQVIERRLRQLPQATLAILDVAAVAGREFLIDTIARAQDIEPAQALELLEPALTSRLVGVVDGSLSTYRFSHVLVRDVIYAGMSPVRQARVHGAVGDALEVLEDPRRLSEVVHHFTMAASLGYVGKAVDVAYRASRQAQTMLAFEQAEQILRTALETLQVYGPDPRREITVRSRLAILLRKTAGFTSPEVPMAVARVRELARDLPDAPEVVGTVWALFAYELGRAHLNEAERIAQELISEAGEGDAGFLAAGLQARAVVHGRRGRYVDAAVDFGRSMESIDQLDLQQWRTRGLVHTAACCRCDTVIPLWMLGRGDEAQAHVQAVLDHADRHAEHFNAAYGRLSLAWLAMLRRDPSAALAWAAPAAALSGEHGYAQLRAMAEVVQGWATALEGDPRSGVQRITDGLKIAESTELRMLRPMHLGLLGEAYHIAGQRDKALAAIESALAAVRTSGERFFLAELQRLRGDLTSGADAAQAWFDDALATAREQGAIALEQRIEGSRAQSPP